MGCDISGFKHCSGQVNITTPFLRENHIGFYQRCWWCGHMFDPQYGQHWRFPSIKRHFLETCTQHRTWDIDLWGVSNIMANALDQEEVIAEKPGVAQPIPSNMFYLSQLWRTFTDRTVSAWYSFRFSTVPGFCQFCFLVGIALMIALKW